MERTCLPLLIVSLTSLLVSCATTQIHYVDEGAASDLKGPRSVAIGGVLTTPRVRSLDREDISDISNTIDRQLSKKRRKLSVFSHMLFEGIVGRSFARPQSDRTTLAAFLSPAQRQKVKSSRFDYILFFVLSSEQTWCDIDESESTDTEHNYDKHGNVISCCTTTTYTTSSRSHRMAEGDFYLFDSRTGKRVWKAESRHSESNTRSSCSTFGYPLPPPHPDPPTLGDVVENMAQSMARKFPK